MSICSPTSLLLALRVVSCPLFIPVQVELPHSSSLLLVCFVDVPFPCLLMDVADDFQSFAALNNLDVCHFAHKSTD